MCEWGLQSSNSQPVVCGPPVVNSHLLGGPQAKAIFNFFMVIVDNSTDCNRRSGNDQMVEVVTHRVVLHKLAVKNTVSCVDFYRWRREEQRASCWRVRHIATLPTPRASAIQRCTSLPRSICSFSHSGHLYSSSPEVILTQPHQQRTLFTSVRRSTCRIARTGCR